MRLGTYTNPQKPLLHVWQLENLCTTPKLSPVARWSSWQDSECKHAAQRFAWLRLEIQECCWFAPLCADFSDQLHSLWLKCFIRLKLIVTNTRSLHLVCCRFSLKICFLFSKSVRKKCDCVKSHPSLFFLILIFVLSINLFDRAGCSSELCFDVILMLMDVHTPTVGAESYSHHFPLCFRCHGVMLGFKNQKGT